MSQSKLKAWQAAGLIDAPTADRIRAWEAENARPLAQWAMLGIGALAIGLGLISVVAANWDAIPGTLRLAVHFAAMAALAIWLALSAPKIASEHPGWLDAALFVLGMLGLTFFAHIGQVYQTSSPLWQALGLWLLLFAPLYLALGQGWPTAIGLMTALVFMCWSHAQVLTEGTTTSTPLMVRAAAQVSAPALLAALAAWQSPTSPRVHFWRHLGHLATAYALGGASLLAIAASFDNWAKAAHILSALATICAIGLGTAALTYRARPGHTGPAISSNKATASILAAAALTAPLADALSGSSTFAALLFMGLWVSIAGAALHTGWRGLFQQAVALIALRLIILSFELGGDLLTSGAGLIASGLLILAISFAAMRIAKTYAPQKEQAA